MSTGVHERWLVADLTIDVGAQAVLRDGEALTVPKLSFRFLEALIRAAPNIVSVDELMERVWAGVFVNGETVTQRAKLLRGSLGDDPRHPRYFTARRGLGYQMVAVPQPLLPSRPAPASSPTAAVVSGSRGLKLAAATLLALGAAGPATLSALPETVQTMAAAPVRVAVLRFDNLSSDPDDAFIARSIPEMVLDRLSSVDGLSVIARDSALLSPAASAPAAEAARQLGAAFVVKGSVQRVGDTLRVTCFVVDASRHARIWSERFDWPVGRIYALQDRIAERVAASLEGRARGLGSLPVQQGMAHDSVAYLAFLKGKSLLSRYTVAETDAAAIQFERAVKLDPEFPEALVALFDARMQAAFLRKDDLALARARNQPLLDRALRRQPDSGPALFAEAMWSDLPGSEREALFRRAAELDPSNTRGLTTFAEFLDGAMLLPGARIPKERPQEAKLLIDRVLTIDPLSPQTRWWAVQHHFKQQPPEQIEKLLARELEIDPLNYIVAERYAFRQWMFRGETADAIERMERVISSDPQNPSAPHFAAAFYLDVNDPAAARTIAETTPASRDASRVLLAQYVGDWRKAGAAAYDRRGFLFNQVQNWNWAQAIRDHALNTREFARGAQAIASRYDIDLQRPRVTRLAQMTVAPTLGHILLAKGDRIAGTTLLEEAVRWIDTHPSYGLAGRMRYRAAAMMLLGDRDQALKNLRASVEPGHDTRFWWYLVNYDPVWAPVRSDPRFKAIAELCRKAAAEQRVKLDALRRAGKVPIRRNLTTT